MIDFAEITAQLYNVFEELDFFYPELFDEDRNSLIKKLEELKKEED